jgi:hypothetical protein
MANIVSSRVQYNIVYFKACADFIPVLSTLKHITDLFQKCFICPFLSDRFINENIYFLQNFKMEIQIKNFLITAKVQ